MWRFISADWLEPAAVVIPVAPYRADQRNAAVVQFPGGYIAEIHSPVSK